MHFILRYILTISCILSWDISWPYPAFYPAIYPFLSINILTFILLVIRSGSRLIRLVVACCLIRPSFACPSQQQGKPLCFYFPNPRCGHRRLRARARRRSGTGARCCPRRRRVSAAAAASKRAGRGEGGGWGRRISVASAGQERRQACCYVQSIAPCAADHAYGPCQDSRHAWAGYYAQGTVFETGFMHFFSQLGERISKDIKGYWQGMGAQKKKRTKGKSQKRKATRGYIPRI